MRLRLIYLFSLVLFVGCLPACNSAGDNNEKISTDLVKNPNTASGTTNSGQLPAMKFEETEHDFGKLIDGETVSYEFQFTNSGKSDLIIVDVSTSCGCTVPSFPKTPIHPGANGAIKVSYNSSGKHGFQAKNVLVVANTQPNTTLLRIKAQVVSPNSDK